ncbi:hypothetical protein RA280_30585 [Cupriavidus sp. CV2]|uniref:hypothetical protein n=1 Tax=Cupriavidus ulmosensis TaxID=3065913 RepID=UPI00296B2028|nr:hypothetical protein [Cupriavidus sp. CV2]MDW3686013.1 hypothetical protein [Cupriavidus sp. CV2]
MGSRSERYRLLGYLALCMVAFALITVLCVTLQDDNEQRAARKVRQMDSRATATATATTAGQAEQPAATRASR